MSAAIARHRDADRRYRVEVTLGNANKGDRRNPAMAGGLGFRSGEQTTLTFIEMASLPCAPGANLRRSWRNATLPPWSLGIPHLLLRKTDSAIP
ncbi:MAG: hypothetical protein ACLPSW_13390 [Roseiarcus sp.]